ncbi:protein EARLY RESPONSIVE TO DEHYDRATION 15 [Mangifera indica]|uniref:protein EARLY RESPONSIVE TO DEHYDRATION 15 n=1 Tax=Mangifera indica TaxID=29780 RepID=UPI001CFB94A9|nr:protein EARLY RESPONSIVE TO DEHYDRATION 15 [Mangifera indica]XP_044505572.1 protein EARLY RESPONSIVE TO DEHYDRATION 15 [Mangifera indica]
MALVSGGTSRLNPNAPLFIPAAFRQVVDFSPEWWQLITTSTWYREYWLSQHQGEDGFYDNDQDDLDFDSTNVADLLPDTFDLDAGEFFADHFVDFVSSYETEVGNVSSPLPANAGLEKDAQVLKNLQSLKSPKAVTLEPAKYAEKAPKYVNPKRSPRCIQQPR